MFSHFWQHIRQSFLFWLQDRSGTMAAGISYYAIFSFAPLLIIFFFISGFFLQGTSFESSIENTITSYIGSESAPLVLNLLHYNIAFEQHIWVSMISILIFFMGASQVFRSLKDSLNEIWKPFFSPSSSRIKHHVGKFLLSFLVTLLLPLLSIFSFVLSAGISFVLQKGVHLFGSEAPFFLHSIDYAVSFFISVLFFFILYFVLSTRKFSFFTLLKASVLNAVLFIVLKYIMGLYISLATVFSLYGAAGFMLIFLLWIYYLASVILFGAEYIKVLSTKNIPSVKEKRQY